jgi:hypothetical protein
MKRVMITLALILSPGAAIQARADDPAQELARMKSEYGDVFALDGIAKGEVLAIARLLRSNPSMAIDQTHTSGEYCLKSGMGTMAHYAGDPSKTREDIVYEFDAAAFTKAGLDTSKLPALPALGKMEPGQWYFLPQGQVDPHHKHAMPGDTLLIAVDVR